MRRKKQSVFELLFQLVFNFALPLIVLTRFSSENMLGPTKGLILALSFPVIYEIYNLVKNKHFSWISVISIGGILLTGAISLLELSTGWLAVRRSASYLIVALGISGAELLGFTPAEKIASQAFNFEKIYGKLKAKSSLQKLFRKCSYLTAGLFIVVTFLSYSLTRAVVTAHTNTTQFNQQYASLRIWSLAVVTTPLVIGAVAIFIYATVRLEKLTGLDMEEILKA